MLFVYVIDMRNKDLRRKKRRQVGIDYRHILVVERRRVLSTEGVVMVERSIISDTKQPNVAIVP